MTDKTETGAPDINLESVEDQLAIKAIAAQALLNMEPMTVYLAEALRFATQGAGKNPAQLDKVAAIIKAVDDAMDGAVIDLPQNAEAKAFLRARLNDGIEVLTIERDNPAPALSEGVTLTNVVGNA